MGLVVLYSAAYQNARVLIKVFMISFLLCGDRIYSDVYFSRIDYRRFMTRLCSLCHYVISFVLVMVKGSHALARSVGSIAGITFQPSEIANWLI